MFFFRPCFAVTLLCALVGLDAFGQSLDNAEMKDLETRERVAYINTNFYKLYSADFQHAADLAKWASETAATEHWASEEAWAQMNWGVITFLSSDYQNVLPKFFRSAHLFDSLGDKSGIAAVNNEMAVFYHKQKDNEKSEQCLDIAEENARAVNDRERLSTTLHHRGVWLSSAGNYRDARPYFEEVRRIRTEIKDSVGLGYIYLDFAEMALNDGDIEVAIDYLDQSTAIREKIGDRQGVIINKVNKGETFYNAGRYRQALPLFIAGINEGKLIGYTDLVRHCYNYAALTSVALNDYKHAYTYQEANHALSDSLFNIQRTKVIQDMEAKYETEKKNQKIVMMSQEADLHKATIERNYFLIVGLSLTLFLLVVVFFLWRKRNHQKQLAVLQEQKIRLREAQINAVIESQERERRRFASDLHDGMGQLISALQLNISALRNPTSFERRDELFEASDQLLTDVHDEIRNIAFNLMPPVLVKEGLVPAIQELIRKINKVGRLKAELSAFDVDRRLPQVIEISLYRVVQELLSNLMKYSKATEVTVSLTGHEDEWVLTIDDNGDGFDLNAFKNSKDGNGWRNVNSRINLVKGEIEIDTQLGRKNTTVIITVPTNLTHEKENPPVTTQNT